MRHHLLLGAFFLCVLPSFAIWLTLLDRIFDAVLSRTEDAGWPEAVGGGSLSTAVFVVGVGDSLGADVGGRALRRNEPDKLNEEREDNEDVEGLGCNGEESSEGAAAPSVCP